MRFLLISLLLVQGAFSWTKTYEGYKIFEVRPTKSFQVTALNQLEDDTYVRVLDGPVLNKDARVLVAPEKMPLVKATLRRNRMEFSVLDIDIAAELKQQWAELEQNKAYNVSDFNTIGDMYAEVDRLADSCAGLGLTCTVSTIGASLRGFEIRAIQVSTGTFGDKPIWWYDSCIHAREWLACATTMNFLDMIINGYGIDPEVDEFLNQYDFSFIPIMNPEGYNYTWTDDRFWRKNRRDNSDIEPSQGPNCTGVDVNRNFDFNWSEPGASASPCSDTYHGPSAASEPETQAVENYFNSLPFTPWVGLSYHTYGMYLLIPYGDGTSPPTAIDENNANMAACNAIEAVHGDNWLCGNSREELYATSGTSVDWMRSVGIKHSITPELRGGGSGGFNPPASDIPIAVNEMWIGMIALRDQIAIQNP